MGNIETMIKWMKDREGKVTYSMINRLGPNSYDCSSAVYFSLRASGFLPDGSMGNTDTLFGDLERNNWKQIEMTNGVFEVQRGDVFIWGTRGASGGEYGHTGIFVDSKANIIHCNFGYNGITTNPHNNIWNANSQPPITVYRPAISTPKPTPSTKFKVGEIVTFTNIATNWVGGAKIGFFSMMRNFRVNRLNDDGTIYIRMMDDSWGSNVYERDIQRAPNNSIERNDVVKLRPQATHWVNGNAINIDNKT
ncbi:peptidoglycan amidohydrolase family protein, partial [Enterococcus quebecensis]